MVIIESQTVGRNTQGSPSPTTGSTQDSPNPMSEVTVQTHLTLQQLGAVPTVLHSLFCAHQPLVKNLSLTPSLTLTQNTPAAQGEAAAVRSRAGQSLPLPGCQHWTWLHLQVWLALLAARSHCWLRFNMLPTRGPQILLRGAALLPKYDRFPVRAISLGVSGFQDE